MEEFKDRTLKYVELPRVFSARASQIDITAKQHLRACERLAEHLSKQKPKTPAEFERVEWMKDFVVKSADLNEKTIELLDYIKGEITEISEDAKILCDGAKQRDIIQDQSEVIQMAWSVRDKAVNELYEIKKQQIGSNKATV